MFSLQLRGEQAVIRESMEMCDLFLSAEMESTDSYAIRIQKLTDYAVC